MTCPSTDSPYASMTATTQISSSDDEYADKNPTVSSTKNSSFFGRSEELQLLHKTKHQVLDDNAAPLIPAVLVWGVSGTGKSHLIRQFLAQTKQESPCYIIQGKYDEYTGSSDPFSALVQALNDFSSQLKSGTATELGRIRSRVKAAFGNGGNDQSANSVLSALINVVPSLSILLDEDCTSDLASMSSSSSHYSLRQPSSANRGGINETVWNRLQYIFLQFVKAISTKERPVYLYLDDLQWSSPIALELLANLASDPELKHFLFLGSIRQETNPHDGDVFEVATDSALHVSFLSRLQSQNKEMTQITIRNLSMHDTKQFLSTLLGNHPINNDLIDLANKIHAKTQGNIFFTIQALEELQRSNVLVYDDASSQWQWDLQHGGDGDDVSISSDIVAIIDSKLKQLPKDLQQVLSIAAYVRATFDVTALLHVVQNEQRCVGASSLFVNTTKVIDEEYLTELLEKAVLEQLLSNPIGGTKYRFVHDRIQEAAHGMIPHGEVRTMLRLRIGHCLLEWYRACHGHDPDTSSPTDDGLPQNNAAHQANTNASNEVDHGLLFVAVDHLNSVPTKDHMFSVKLNLEVGEQAIHMAALASAVSYLDKAMAELKRVRNAWEEHYDICLRLYRARSDVELSLGHFELGYSLGQEVLAKAKTLDEKLPTYLSMARGLGREDNHTESFAMCLSATTQIGVFPKRWYLGHVGRDMMKIKSFFKKNDDDAILQMPFMTDERRLMAMKLLPELAMRAHMTHSMVVWLVSLCKLIRNTIEFGLCEDSGFAVATYGILSSASGDQAMAMRCADLAKRILTKTGGESLSGWVSLVTAGFITTFVSPIADVVRENQRGYKCSMEAGEFELGFINWQMSAMLAFLGGYELQHLVQAIDNALQQFSMYNVKSIDDSTFEFLSMVQTLAGKKAIDWSEIEECANRDVKREKLTPAQGFYIYCKMVLATYFRRYDLGKKLASSYYHAVVEEKACFAIVSKGIFTGLNAAGRYHETGKRKHLRMLSKMLAELKHTVKTKGPRFIHHVLMLKAELASIQKHKQHGRNVIQAYDLAILMACNASFVQDAALTCELAGEHCIREGCSKEETSAYFVKAVGFYADWGCVVKVDDLKQRRPEYLAGLDESRRAANAKDQDGRVVLFGNNTSSSGQARVGILSSYTPSLPLVGASIAGSGTKKTHGLQHSIDGLGDDDGNLSVLTDGS